MANMSWRQESPAQADTGILDVLVALVAQGGQLYGARRWADNPLTLTHLRWQGPSGGMLDAFRRPGSTMTPNDAESQAWVELALHFPTTHPSAAGVDAPWLPLNVQPAEASQWIQQIRQSHAQQHSRPPMPMTPPPERSYSQSGRNNFSSDSGTYSNRPPNSNEGYRSYPSAPLPQVSVSGQNRYDSPPNHNSFAQGDSSQWTGETARAAVDEQEIALIPCIEVELPPLLHNQLATDYYRDFARDVAVHFRQAMYQFREVREVRGWMRGDRLVLAARFVIGTGTRRVSQGEMERVAQLMADVLTQRTLPYTQLGFANPGEWMQGRPLPEA